jgi:hypothetical protein
LANQLQVFMVEEDERAFLRFMERFVLSVYPRRVPEDWETFRARAADLARFPEEEIYLVATDIGPAQVDKIKRGPDKGFWRVDEVRSPVIFWQRCLKNEEGELLSGQVWAELDVTPQTGRRTAAPDQFRSVMLEVDSWLKKTFRKGDPKPYLVGPATARLVKQQQLKLRTNEHWGREIRVHR